MANCPVCQTEYVEEMVNFCSTCGWDLTPYPLTFAGQIPEVFLQKERTKLIWARGVWKQLQLQSDFSKVLSKLQLAEKEREQFQNQITQLFLEVDQIRQSLVSAPSSSLAVQLVKPPATLPEPPKELTQKPAQRLPIFTLLPNEPAPIPVFKENLKEAAISDPFGEEDTNFLAEEIPDPFGAATSDDLDMDLGDLDSDDDDEEISGFLSDFK